MNNPAYNANSTTEKLFLNDDMGSFLTVGASYDDGGVLATAEFAKRTVEDAKGITNLTGAYVTLGYHFGDFTPYLTYQTQETDDKNRAPLLPGVVPFGINSDFNALSIGMKYEFSKVAIKAEVTNYEFGKSPSDQSIYGVYRNTLVEDNAGNALTTLKSAKVFNLTLETMF